MPLQGSLLRISWYICMKLKSANMGEFTKQERKQLTALIKKGNLARCDEWLGQTKDLINKPYGEHENAFDRCMELTKSARDFFKEAMQREDYYRNTYMLSGVAILLREGYLCKEDVATVENEALRNKIMFLAE